MFYNSETLLPFKNLDKGQLFIIVVSDVVLSFINNQTIINTVYVS